MPTKAELEAQLKAMQEEQAQLKNELEQEKAKKSSAGREQKPFSTKVEENMSKIQTGRNGAQLEHVKRLVAEPNATKQAVVEGTTAWNKKEKTWVACPANSAGSARHWLAEVVACLYLEGALNYSKAVALGLIPAKKEAPETETKTRKNGKAKA